VFGRDRTSIARGIAPFVLPARLEQQTALNSAVDVMYAHCAGKLLAMVGTGTVRV
jgi:hypothetical protein